jgi:hypothetical protein
MSFTRVSRSVKKERKTMHGFQTPNNRKTKKIVKKATKYKKQSVCSSEGRMSKFKRKKH